MDVISDISSISPEIDYFTWGPDLYFLDKLKENDLSEYPALIQVDTKDGCDYVYPDNTMITGLSDKGMEWLKQNGGYLILPACATSIKSSNDGTDSAFGRWNRKYGSELNKLIRYICVQQNTCKIGDYAFAGLEFVIEADINSKFIGTKAFANTSLRFVNFNNKTEVIQAEAFAFCLNLHTVVGADNLSFISEKCFAFCVNLKYVNILSRDDIKVNSGAFWRTYSLKNVGPISFSKNMVFDIFDSSACMRDFGYYYDTPDFCVLPYHFEPCCNLLNFFALIPDFTLSRYKSSIDFWLCLTAVYDYYYAENLTPSQIIERVKDYGLSSLVKNILDLRLDCYDALGLIVDIHGCYRQDALGHHSFDMKLDGFLDDYQSLYDALRQKKLVIVNSISIINSECIQKRYVVYGVTADGQLMCVDGNFQEHLDDDPDCVDVESKFSSKPYCFNTEPWAILHPWDNYIIVDKE